MSEAKSRTKPMRSKTETGNNLVKKGIHPGLVLGPMLNTMDALPRLSQATARSNQTSLKRKIQSSSQVGSHPNSNLPLTMQLIRERKICTLRTVTTSKKLVKKKRKTTQTKMVRTTPLTKKARVSLQTPDTVALNTISSSDIHESRMTSSSATNASPHASSMKRKKTTIVTWRRPCSKSTKSVKCSNKRRNLSIKKLHLAAEEARMEGVIR